LDTAKGNRPRAKSAKTQLQTAPKYRRRRKKLPLPTENTTTALNQLSKEREKILHINSHAPETEGQTQRVSKKPTNFDSNKQYHTTSTIQAYSSRKQNKQYQFIYNNFIQSNQQTLNVSIFFYLERK